MRRRQRRPEGVITLAAWVHTEWHNTMTDHVIPHITGRACDGVLSIGAQGLDAQGELVDLGWIQARQIGADSFTAAYVGADATNNLVMDVDPAAKTMHVKITTQHNGGNVEGWFGDYKLLAIK